MSNVVERLRKAGYRVRTRPQWGSRHQDVYAYRLRAMPVTLPVPHMFAHITVTAQDGDAGARQVEAIGQSRFGSGGSYQWLVDHETHTIFNVQPLAAKGTHTVNDKGVPGFPKNLNYFGHAVAFMAMPGDTFCDECAELFSAIMAASKLEGVVREDARYHPHSKFAAKDCPTSAVRDKLPAIHRKADQMVAARSLDAAPAPRKRRDRRPRVSLSELRAAAKTAEWSRKRPRTEDDVLLVVQALKAEGVPNYKQWQVKLGYEGKDADGVPGKESLTKLGDKHGFRVVK